MKESVQRLGRFLSGMVMPNISVFIAWGFITALFIETGWAPNATLAQIVDPMNKFLLPILIGYTGGTMVYQQRGGVVGAAATIGVLAGADVPMFIGAMAAGPLGGYLIKKVDQLLEGKIPSGFEMLINNFSAGILGAILAALGCLAINPICLAINDFMGSAVNLLVENNLLPLTSIFVEPAKVLFLNNAINHGIFSPLGIEQVAEAGKSIFFLIEANPGPGLGLLLAYCVFAKGNVKQSAPGAVIIHFFGGIHEIYFPYILMNPLTILAVIAGGASGVLVNVLFNSGLVSPASPGSIIAIMAMCEKGSYVGVLLSILVATVVSFLIASIILKASKKGEGDLEEAAQKMQEMKSESKGAAIPEVKMELKRIVFACDAGMGSSAMGAASLTKKLNSNGIDIKVEHFAVNEIPEDAQIVVTHQSLVDRVRSTRENVIIFPITNFMGGKEYDEIVEKIKNM